MLEDAFLRIFSAYIRDLQPFDLEKYCKLHNIELAAFTNWVASDPIRRAKLTEVCETRLLDYDIKKQKRNA